jgi:hypothetical protein
MGIGLGLRLDLEPEYSKRELLNRHDGRAIVPFGTGVNSNGVCLAGVLHKEREFLMASTNSVLLDTPYSVIDNAVAEISYLADKVSDRLHDDDYIGILSALEGMGVCRFFLTQAITELISSDPKLDAVRQVGTGSVEDHPVSCGVYL